MRTTILMLATLCLFATAQVAMAFDMCCTGTEQSHDAHAGHNHNTPSKGDSASKHCPMSAHHSLAVLKDFHLVQPSVTAEASIFAPPLFHELSVHESLIEPPSLA